MGANPTVASRRWSPRLSADSRSRADRGSTPPASRQFGHIGGHAVYPVSMRSMRRPSASGSGTSTARKATSTLDGFSTLKRHHPSWRSGVKEAGNSLADDSRGRQKPPDRTPRRDLTHPWDV